VPQRLGATQPQVVDASVVALSGRGLTIVEALSERWWRDVQGPVSTVHAMLPLWPAIR
jgi:hypothetical protein